MGDLVEKTKDQPITKGIIKPIELDFKDIRYSRQKNNNMNVYLCIQQNNIAKFTSVINNNELSRTLEDLAISFGDLWEKCKNDYLFCKVICRLLSKNSSRQGGKDENTQLTTINLFSQQFGIFISKLPNNEIRPIKCGGIISRNDMKKNNIQNDSCLKSFDGKIDGKIRGYISSKISFGNGGGQNTSFREQDTYSEWWCKYKKNSDEILLILIDTDRIEDFNILKKKYIQYKNILWFNHYDFQDYIIKNYSVESI